MAQTRPSCKIQPTEKLGADNVERTEMIREAKQLNGAIDFVAHIHTRQVHALSIWLPK